MTLRINIPSIIGISFIGAIAIFSNIPDIPRKPTLEQARICETEFLEFYQKFPTEDKDHSQRSEIMAILRLLSSPDITLTKLFEAFPERKDSPCYRFE